MYEVPGNVEAPSDQPKNHQTNNNEPEHSVHLTYRLLRSESTHPRRVVSQVNGSNRSHLQRSSHSFSQIHHLRQLRLCRPGQGRNSQSQLGREENSSYRTT